jgi:prepilin-type N-terminal cleavage/methylation domain-containing protein
MSFPAVNRFARAAAARRGFTLPEVIIGSAVGSFVLAGVMSSFIMLGRSGQRMYHYAGMETDSRRAFDRFSQDARMASNIVLNSDSSATLTVPERYASTANEVTYFRRTFPGDSVGSFYFHPGNHTVAMSVIRPVLERSGEVLARNVVACNFVGRPWAGETAITYPNTGNVTIRRINLQLRLRAGAGTAAEATENVVSSTFLLRNRRTN